MTENNVLYKYRKDLERKMAYIQDHPELYDDAEEQVEALGARIRRVTQQIQEADRV